ncbi:putative Receptor protein kinase [Quillaja saponaria]|uniref:Receptor protein kinase n=1 Tax=Quillaja saponaria TaxID=32244 RepID=A0AAD7LRI2_QUISA|nr:putative Receptor protein kinase [Quillaja saponaria]
MSCVISFKTDIFRYGVLILENVTSKKNNYCYQTDGPINLVGYAWQLWIEGELIEPILDGSCSPCEVLRCIHIGLLCVQDKATYRPTMLDVVSFLSSETIQLAQPNQPAFFNNIVVKEPDVLPANHDSLNDVTISDVNG